MSATIACLVLAGISVALSTRARIARPRIARHQPERQRKTPPAVVFNSLWACPQCGLRYATNTAALLAPPVCRSCHEPCEMEQVTPAGFAAPARQDTW